MGCYIIDPMNGIDLSRRRFLSTAPALAGVALLSGHAGFAWTAAGNEQTETKAEYTLTIATQPIELAPNRIVSVTVYNGQFPAPRQPADFVRASPLRVSLLSHARSCRRGPEPRPVQWPGRSGVRRTEE